MSSPMEPRPYVAAVEDGSVDPEDGAAPRRLALTGTVVAGVWVGLLALTVACHLLSVALQAMGSSAAAESAFTFVRALNGVATIVCLVALVVGLVEVFGGRARRLRRAGGLLAASGGVSFAASALATLVLVPELDRRDQPLVFIASVLAMVNFVVMVVVISLAAVSLREHRRVLAASSAGGGTSSAS